jgi:hypothetical protein
MVGYYKIAFTEIIPPTLTTIVHRDPHGPACIQNSVMDPDLIGSESFWPHLIRVRIRNNYNGSGSAASHLLSHYNIQQTNLSFLNITELYTKSSQPSLSSCSHPANHSQLLVSHY